MQVQKLETSQKLKGTLSIKCLKNGNGGVSFSSPKMLLVSRVERE